ncbi:hypothetical protein Ancab_028583 [Ancistrocladus abbreviatus]
MGSTDSTATSPFNIYYMCPTFLISDSIASSPLPLSPVRIMSTTVEVVEAASILLSLQFAKLDDQARKQLHGQIQGTQLHQQQQQPNQDRPPIQALEGMIRECSIRYEKQLTKSDVDRGQGRLAFKNEYVDASLRPMLREGEILEGRQGIQVFAYDGEGEEYQMTFKGWGKMVVLTSGWNQFVKRHELREEEDFVTVWMFRRSADDRLCFAITTRREHGRHYNMKNRRAPKRQRTIEA